MQGQPQMMSGQVPGMQMPMGMPVTTMAMQVNPMGMQAAPMGMQTNPMGMQANPMGMPATTLGMGMGMQPQMSGMGMQPQMSGMAPMGGMMAQQPMMQVQQNVPMSVASAISSGHQSGASTPGGISTDWAVPQQARIRYGQQFQATDRNRTGFLAGVQVDLNKP